MTFSTTRNKKQLDCYLYELSEIIHYFKLWGIIKSNEIENLKNSWEILNSLMIIQLN